jgi:hypothetical protein
LLFTDKSSFVTVTVFSTSSFLIIKDCVVILTAFALASASLSVLYWVYVTKTKSSSPSSPPLKLSFVTYSSKVLFISSEV